MAQARYCPYRAATVSRLHTSIRGGQHCPSPANVKGAQASVRCYQQSTSTGLATHQCAKMCCTARPATHARMASYTLKPHIHSRRHSLHTAGHVYGQWAGKICCAAGLQLCNTLQRWRLTACWSAHRDVVRAFDAVFWEVFVRVYAKPHVCLDGHHATLFLWGPVSLTRQNKASISQACMHALVHLVDHGHWYAHGHGPGINRTLGAA